VDILQSPILIKNIGVRESCAVSCRNSLFGYSPSNHHTDFFLVKWNRVLLIEVKSKFPERNENFCKKGVAYVIFIPVSSDKLTGTDGDFTFNHALGASIRGLPP
jgi:hypothetical protein